ncbi:hypothetical protein JNUCC64_04870 [Streptomyces sp. JNUCC 64]
MESPAENKRTAALALAALGLLLVGAVLVLTLFGAEEDAPDAPSGDRPSAGAPLVGGTGGDAKGGDVPSDDAPEPILTTAEIARAHRVMTSYMSGLSTYAHTDRPGPWAKPLRELTNGDPALEEETALPTGKAWDTCVAARCASRGRAVVVRDALVSNDLVRDSGRTVSSLVRVTVTRTEEGGESTEETNSWLVTARDEGSGTWKVSGFSLFGLGDVGASDRAGG